MVVYTSFLPVLARGLSMTGCPKTAHYQGFPNLWLRQGGLVAGARVLSLGLPHGGAERCSH